MDNALFDKESWKRAIGPAFRGFAYTMILYVGLFVLLIIPFYLIGLLGLDIGSIINPLMALGFVFAFFLAFFKVLDEERPGAVQFKMTS